MTDNSSRPLGSIQFDFEEPVSDPNADTASPIQDIENLDLKKEKELYFKRQHQLLDASQKMIDWRDAHLKMLFWLTVSWVGFLCFLVLLIGFKKWFLWWPLPSSWELIPFSLENTVIVAFFTTTTATVLGLYTVAALWLFKGEKKADPPSSDNQEAP